MRLATDAGSCILRDYGTGAQRWTAFCKRPSSATSDGASAAQVPVERANVFHQQVGGVLGRPVAAAVVLVPGDDVGVVALGEAAQRGEVVGEAGQAGGGLGGFGRVFGV